MALRTVAFEGALRVDAHTPATQQGVGLTLVDVWEDVSTHAHTHTHTHTHTQTHTHTHYLLAYDQVPIWNVPTMY